MLRHPLHSLKRIARLPSEDRDEVLKVLKKNVLRRQGRAGVSHSRSVSRHSTTDDSSSSDSVNNDWKNWVAMQGNAQMVEDDVNGIGKSIGVTFKGDNDNRFIVLSRANLGKKEKLGKTQGEGVQKEKRGLGGLEKRKEVRKLMGDLNPLIICIQETKLQTCDDFLCATLWGNSPHAFSYRPSAGASGGLLTLWDSSEVEVWSTESREHVLWCHGRITKTGEVFYVANVYAPCDDGAKQVLWASLSTRIQSLDRQRVCVCGDFNAVKHVDERRSSRGKPSSLDHIPFNRFIEDNNLVDLPLSGRKFTWFKGDGLSMSRLDRFLLSEEWCLAWPNCKQMASLRGLSDHCSLVLSANEDDWGPRPLRMLKCLERYSGNLPSRVDSLKSRLSVLDQKGEDEVLSDAEIAELHGVTADIHSLSRMHASISWQQSL
ncbi:hypothetical protein TSUD_131000 [Trifolium subterraneum]|nr:hypothetical protein TSUD_131000 [Trifolium subterraneum]